jgi:hypothetical protein
MPVSVRNRRKEIRFRSRAGSRFAWHTDTGRRARRKGWTLDESAHGLGFLIEKPRLPGVGQRIIVHVRGDLESEQYEVRRVVPLAGKLAVVGCERVFGHPTVVAKPPPHRLRAASAAGGG